MEINLLYKGCVKSGNLGDDILFDIFKELIKIILNENFNIKENILEKQKEKIDYSIYDIFVVGGGSIIHPLEISYTSFGGNYDKILFINGAGITDCNEIKNKENIDLFNLNNLLFKHKFLKKNFENIHNYIHIYGGFRGILEEKIFSEYFKDKQINYINDIGLLSNILYKNNNLKINTYNRKMIIINPIRIGGADCFKEKDKDYEEYNNYIDNCLFNFSKYLIENNYFIYILDFTDNLNKYYYDKIISNLNTDNKKYINYYNPHDKNTNDILNIIKQSHIIIATRLHANIIGNSLFIPSLNIAYGIKHINYAITNNLERYTLTTYEKDLNQDNLIKKFKDTELNHEIIKNNLKTINKETYNNYYNDIKKMLDIIINNKHLYKNITLNSSKDTSNGFIKFIIN